MILVAFAESKMQINWFSVVFNNLHNKLRDLGGPNKSNVNRDVKFEGAQILNIMFQKWLLVDSNFRILDLEEEVELEKNSPTEVRRKFFCH